MCDFVCDSKKKMKLEKFKKLNSQMEDAEKYLEKSQEQYANSNKDVEQAMTLYQEHNRSSGTKKYEDML